MSYNSPSGGVFSQFKRVTYSGDGNATHLITVGFAPKFVVAYRSNGPDGFANIAMLAWFDGTVVIVAGAPSSSTKYTFTTPVSTGTTVDVGSTTGLSFIIDVNSVGFNVVLLCYA